MAKSFKSSFIIGILLFAGLTVVAWLPWAAITAEAGQSTAAPGKADVNPGGFNPPIRCVAAKAKSSPRKQPDFFRICGALWRERPRGRTPRHSGKRAAVCSTVCSPTWKTRTCRRKLPRYLNLLRRWGSQGGATQTGRISAAIRKTHAK